MVIITKLVRCGLPSMLFLKDKSKSMKFEIGMVSRGEVGLIGTSVGVGVGVTSGVLSIFNYTSIIIMVVVTTVITPIWLKKYFKVSYQLALFKVNTLLG